MRVTLCELFVTAALAQGCHHRAVGEAELFQLVDVADAGIGGKDGRESGWGQIEDALPITSADATGAGVGDKEFPCSPVGRGAAL